MRSSEQVLKKQTHKGSNTSQDDHVTTVLFHFACVDNFSDKQLAGFAVDFSAQKPPDDTDPSSRVCKRLT